MTAPSTEGDTIDHKIPSWNGDWTTFTDYQLRVELRADSTKKEDLGLLGPRLAGNLVGRAFDAIAEVNREELRKENGWRYLLSYLEGKRGKEKIDLLGDLFTEFFAKKDAHRKDGEDLTDYEPRFRLLVRRLDKAVKESGADGKIPTELYGWMLLNIYMRLDASDTANVRGRAESYKLEDIMGALKKMWSGGGLCIRDQERKKKQGMGYHVEGEVDGTILHEDEDHEEQVPEEEVQELEEASAWFQDALEALLEEPSDGMVLANFKDARKALDQARTSRGFYPVRNPNVRNHNYVGKGNGKQHGFSGQGMGKGNNPYAEKYCLRCGKKGHIARLCPQKPNPGMRKGEGKTDAISFVNFVGWTDEDVESESATVFSVNNDFLSTHAILDSGASDNIVGVETLHDWGEQLEGMGFAMDEEIYIDRQQQKRFTFGNNATAAALGKAYVNIGLFGKQFEVETHVVEGKTPFLLSARFMSDYNVSVNFRTGVAVFRKISDKPFCLKRTPGGHLTVPLLAFAGNDRVYRAQICTKPDSGVQAVSESADPIVDEPPESPSEEGGEHETVDH